MKEERYIKKHTSEIMVGDIVLCFDGQERTVTASSIKRRTFMGTTIFGDSWNLGYKPVFVVK